MLFGECGHIASTGVDVTFSREMDSRGEIAGDSPTGMAWASAASGNGLRCISHSIVASSATLFRWRLWLLGYALGWIVKERFLRNTLALPALVCELLHTGDGPIEPFELENPTDDDVVTIDEHRAHAPR